jgi:hypothetical protein
MGGVIAGVVAMVWSVSADREHRDNMPPVCQLEETVGELGQGRRANVGLLRGVARRILPVKILDARDPGA